MRPLHHGLVSCSVLVWVFCLAAARVAAQPTGGQVVAGTATFSGGPGGLTITQTSGRAIINWQDFSIAAGGFARFVQPDAASATLNRVVSGLPSSVLGSLEANGRVFLINPNGILIGAGARIDTGGFLASTLDVANQDFLAGGDLKFSGDSTAAVQNLGAINALGGDVFLIARRVENAGTISAAGSTVGLVAGSEVLLTTGGSERVFVQTGSAPGALSNAGTITATTAELKAAGGNAYALAINNSGTVRATGSALRNGQVWLVASGGAVESSGTLAAASALGTQGGEVRVLGDSVTLSALTVVDVSGTQTGGTALIGGGFQGQSEGAPNARATTVAASATIDARGGNQGGRVIVWSDELTHFGGTINAQGATGGFVEVSGKQALRFAGQVDTGGGTLLLDPANITVQATAGDQVSTFGTAQIATLLGANNVILAADTDITWNSGAALDYNGIGNTGRTLTLQAGNNILFSGTISDSVAGGDMLHVVLNSDRDASSVGYINLASGTAITTNGGNVTLGGGATPTTGFAHSTTAGQSGVQLSGASITTAGGNVIINGSVNATGVNNGILLNSVTAIDTGTGSITLTGRSTSTSSTVSENNYAILLNRATLTTTSGQVTLDGANTAAISTGAGGIDLNGAGGGTSSIVTTSGNITLTGSGSASGGTSSGHRGINLINSFLVSSASGNVSLTGTGRGAGLTNYGVVLNNSATVKTTGTGNVTITGTGGGTTGFGSGVQIQGLIETTGTGNISINGTGGGTAGFNHGVYVANTVRTTGGGNLTITGQGSLAGTTTGNDGVRIDEGTVQILAGTNRTLTITGTAGTGTSSNSGVLARFSSKASLGAAVTGTMNVTGIGAGSAGGTGNWGVAVDGSSAYESLGAGVINLTGTGGLGGDNHGIKVSTGASNRIGSTTMSGNITLTADMIDLEGAGTVTVQSSGHLQIKPNSGTATIGIGDSAVGTLNLNATEISRLVNGFASISIGHIGGGAAIDVRTQAFHDPLTIHAPQNGASITVNGALSTGSGTSAGSITLRAADNIVLADSTSITTQGQTITLNSDADRLGVGFISLGTSAALASNGGAITLGGGTDPTTGFAASRTANQSGVQLGTSATLASAGGNVIVNGSVNAAGLNAGILLSPSSSISSGAGSMTLSGQASSTTTSNFNNGVTVNGGSLTATTGAIAVTGTSTAASTTGAIGIELSGASAGGKTITTTTGAITLTGTASNAGGATGTHYGVVLHDGFTVGTADGAIAITGTGRGAGASNHGVALDASTVQATGTGTLSLNGTGAAGSGIVNHGIFLDNAAAVTAANGTVALTGTTSSAGNGLNAGTGGGTLSANGAGAMTLTATSNGASLAKAKVTAGSLRVAGAGDFTLTHVQNNIATLAGNLTGSLNLIDNAALTIGTVGGVTGVNVGANTVTIQTLVGNISLASGASVVATGAVATPLVLASAADFINSSGSSALNAGTGRWLVWSTNPANDTRGGLPANFKQYNATYLTTPVAQTTGNGFLYKIAPSITPALQGTVSRAYNATTAVTLTSSHFANTGAVDGDTVTLAHTAATYDTKNVGTSKAVTATGISIASATNSTVTVYGYQLSSTTATGNIGTITAETLTYVADTKSRTYGAANPSFTGTVTGFVTGETLLNATTGTLAFNSTSGLTSNVGSYAINGAGLTANNGNYTFAQAPANATALTITRAAVNLTGTRTYDGNANVTANLFTVGTLPNSETLTLTGTGTVPSKDVATNQTVTVTGLTLGNGTGLASNYTFTGGTQTASITPANLTLTGTRVYNGATTFAASDLSSIATGVNGETFALTGSGTLSTKNVQTSQQLASVAGLTLGAGNTGAAVSTNYNALAPANSSVSVTKAPISITSADVVKTYDGTLTAAGSPVILVGQLFGSDVLTFSGLGPTYQFVGTGVGTGKTVTVSGISVNDGNNGQNYTRTLVNNTTSTINPFAVNLSASRVYNGTTALAANLFSFGTLVGTETLTLTGTGAVTSKDVGTGKAVTGLTLADGTGLASNYTFTGGTQTASITKADLTLSGTRVYNGTTLFAGSNLTATGVAGETFALSGAGDTTNLSSKDVQSGPLASVTGLTLGTSGNGGLGGNYNSLSTTNSAITVTKANLTLTGTRVYNGTTTFASSDLSSLATGVNGETFALTGSGILSTKNVQTAQLLTSVAGLTLGAGNTGAAVATNYNALAPANSSVSVTPAALTLTGTQVYNGLTAFAGANLTATGVNGETFTVTGAGATGNLTTKNVQTNQLLASEAGLTIGTGNTGSAVSTNYTALGVTNSSVSVTPAALTITGFASNDKTYDGLTTAVVATPGTLTGVVSGDAVGFTHTGATFATPNVGTGLTTTLNGVALTGTDRTNYTYAAVTTDPSAITAATLTYNATPATRLYGANNPAFTGTVTGFVNGETLLGATTGTAAFTSTATPANNVGTYAILGSGLTANNSNYLFVQAVGNATAFSITPAPLTITADNKTKVYGAALPTFTATYTGLVNGDSLSVVTGLTLTGTATAASNVGTTAITAANGTAANYTITHAPGALSITPAPLTITADNKSRAFGVANPAFTATYTGLVNGDTTAAVSGLSLATTALIGSPIGNYPITASGATAGNYAITFVDGLLAIGQNLLTITADNKTKLYGAALPTFTASYAGLLNGDTASVVTGLQFNTTALVGSNVGTYTITPFGGTATSYTLAYVAGQLTINPAALTLTATAATRLYGAANPTFAASYAGLVNGDTTAVVTGLTFTTPATTLSNVGSYAITPLNGTAANYTITNVPGALSVTPAPLTIAADNKTKVYGAALPAFTATYTGLVNGDASSVVTGLTLTTPATAASNVGTSAITAANGTATNYTITHTPGALSITPAALTISADNKTKLYGATLPTFTASYTGLVNGDASSVVTGLTLTTLATAASNVGTSAITAANATAANYTITHAPGALSITPAPLTIGVDNKTKVYGAALPTFTASYTGLVNGDTSSVVTGLTLTSLATAATGVGTSAITPANGTATNYTITHTPGALSITPAPLTISADNKTKLYGATLPTFTASYTGLVNGDASSVVTGLTLTTLATAASNVGTNAITAANATAANYTISHAPGALSITPAPLTITADNKARGVGAPNPVFTASYTGLVNSDTTAAVSGLAFTTTALTNSPIGNYPITPSGATAGNYAITFVDGLLAIGQNLLTITADNKTKIYGAALPTFTASYTGFVNGDTAAVVTGLQFNTTALIGSNVGTYTITPFGATAPTYALAYVAGQLTINPAALTLTATAATRLYGAANPTFAASYAGLVNGDTSAVVTGLTFATPATTLSNVGTYALTPANGTATNYTITHVPGALSVTPAPLTIAADNKTKLYGAALPTFTATYTGLVNGDASSVVTGLTLTGTATAASNVGTTAITAANGTATNYTITHAPGALSITPAPLTITADNKSRAVGVANPVFTATYTGLVNSDTTAAVSNLSLTTTALTNSPIGNYPITPAGATAANYAITFVDGLLTIGQNVLTISADNKTKTYGAPLPVFTASYAGLVNGDTANVVTGLQFSTTASATSNVGTYTITPFGATAPAYTLAYVSGLLTINPASLTITASSATRLYGAANPAFAASYAGLVNGDTTSVVTGLTLNTPATAASNVGSYTLTPANGSAANYTITHVPGALSVTPAPLTIAADNKSRAFGVANPPLTASYTGFVNGDTAAVVSGLAVATTAATNSPGGNYPITAAGATAANYALTFVNGTLSISPQGLNLLTITADNKTKTYGAPLPTFTASYAGLLNGDTPSVVTGLQFITTASASSNVGTYTITPFGGTAASYTLAYVSGLLTINPANLLIAADNKARTFGVANPALTANFTGFVNGDTAAVVSGLSLATPATPASPVGNYAITAAGATAANYAITFSPGALAIAPAGVTITADNKTKTYGAPLPVFTASFAGFLNGDTSAVVTGLQFATTATVGSNVGTFAITPFGATAPNYSLAYVPGLLTINPAALTLTANNAARTYGAGNPLFTGTFAGFVNGDTAAAVTGLTFTTPATATSGIGSYAITPGGASAPNYALTFLPGTLTINRASLTLTAANASRDFGAPNPPFTGTFTGFVNGDTSAVVSGLTFSTPATPTSAAGDYAITPSGATAANYSFTFVNGSLRVIAPTVTVGPDPRPVVTINDRPAVTTELAVVNLDGRLVLVPVDPPAGRPVSLDGQLTLALSEATTPIFTSSPVGPGTPVPGGTPRPDGPNFGNFELLPSLAGSGGGVTLGGGGGVGATQLNEPGVFRESTINLGGFNVIYHEAVAEARQQVESNTALGSSYREFSDDENPQINHVRAKVDRKPADSTGGRSSGGAL